MKSHQPSSLSGCDHLGVEASAERTLLAASSAGVHSELPSVACAHHFFELQAAQTPKAVAVVSPNGSLSYRELNERANQLAHYLRGCGITPEARVGLCLESSLEAIVGILAVLKAGGAYLPVDPSYPAARIRVMLSEAQVTVVLTRKALLNDLPKLGARTICVDTDWPRITAESTNNPDGGVTSTNLAYIIYTSGSTGQPKGVMVEHRSLVNYIESAIGDYCLTAQDRVLQFSSLSWDTSVEEIFPCLSSGATLVLPDGGPVELPPRFWRSCCDSDVTVLNLPTAYWEVLVNDTAFSASALPPSLRLLITGGERVLANQVARWQRETAGLAKLVNTYGVTEATAAVTSFSEMEKLPHTQDRAGRVPIGRPIRNVQTHVLDSKMQPVPVGEAGELYIGGLGLARGYVRRPDLTAERFVPNPFSAEDGARLYRTGDRVRWCADGQLEYLGRQDQQVKLRGYRIELQEIEEMLAGHSGVQQAAVVIHQHPDGGGQLVAYVVLASPTGPSGQQLRRYLLEELPAYMVPATYVALDVLPLTPSGKLDRRALSKLERLAEGAGGPTQGPIEEMLATIWVQVLGVSLVGRQDDFFVLGGDSIRSLSIVSRAAQLGWRITVRQVLQYPTIAELARVAVPLVEWQAVDGPALRPVNNGSEGPPLSLAQRHIWLLNQALPGRNFFSISSPLRMLGRLDVGALEKSFTELIRRHEILRTTYSVRDGRPSQMIALPSQFDLPVMDLQHLLTRNRENEVQNVIASRSRRHFDLSCDLPMNAVLLRLEAEEYALVLTFHHVAFDDWSCGIFSKELAELYQGYVTGELPTHRVLPTQYADYATSQNGWLQSPAATQELAYWLERLGGGPTLIKLPTDHARFMPRTFRYDERIMSLGRPTTERLQEFSCRARTTPFMTLLAALNAFLGQITGQEDIWVGILSADRSAAHTENLIGLFLNTLILRTDLSGDPTFSQLVQRVRTVTLEAFDHSTLPFERLLDALRERFDLDRIPLFQVLFIFQNAPAPTLELFRLIVEPWKSARKQGLGELRLCTFDLIIEVVPNKGCLDVIWHYNADLFEPDTIDEMLTHFCLLLASRLEHPDQRLSNLSS